MLGRIRDRGLADLPTLIGWSYRGGLRWRSWSEVVRGGRNLTSERVVKEHRHLEDLFEALSRTFAAQASDENVWEAFEELSNELHAHFDQEDQLYFPAICALKPDLKEPMVELARRHDMFRDQLRRIGDHLGHGDLEGAAGVFHTVDRSFRVHEQLEEQILERLESELELEE